MRVLKPNFCKQEILFGNSRILRRIHIFLIAAIGIKLAIVVRSVVVWCSLGDRKKFLTIKLAIKIGCSFRFYTSFTISIGLDVKQNSLTLQLFLWWFQSIRRHSRFNDFLLIFKFTFAEIFGFSVTIDLCFRPKIFVFFTQNMLHNYRVKSLVCFFAIFIRLGLDMWIEICLSRYLSRIRETKLSVAYALRISEVCFHITTDNFGINLHLIIISLYLIENVFVYHAETSFSCFLLFIVVIVLNLSSSDLNTIGTLYTLFLR